MTHYVVYQGDEVLAVGTLQEVADALGVRTDTIYYYASPCRFRNVTPGATVAVRVRDEDMERTDA